MIHTRASIGTRATIGLLVAIGLCFLGGFVTHAQTNNATSTVAGTGTLETNIATDTASSAAELITRRFEEVALADKKDTTQPEHIDEKVEILTLLQSRRVEEPNFFNFFAYWVQQSIFLGIPSNTVVLILLTPILATLVAFVRVVIGFQTLELFVPIALSFAFVAVGVTLGLIILAAVVLASYVSKVIMKHVTIMYFPKRALSMTLLSLFVFAALTITASFELSTIQNISIFPVLILTLLGDSVVSIQLYKSLSETVSITVVTLGIGLLGYLLATSQMVLHGIILYPELVLLTFPANMLIGRYFGLRLNEYFRFGQVE